MKERDFIIKITNGRNFGHLRKHGREYVLDLDGTLTVNHLGTGKEYCGSFVNGGLTDIPEKHVRHASRYLENLTYMHLVLSGRARI